MGRNARQHDQQPGLCRGKKIFLSFQQASHAARRTRRAKGREDDHYEPYHCLHCQAFHVGSKPIEKGRRMKLRVVR